MLADVDATEVHTPLPLPLLLLGPHVQPVTKCCSMLLGRPERAADLSVEYTRHAAAAHCLPHRSLGHLR